MAGQQAYSYITYTHTSLGLATRSVGGSAVCCSLRASAWYATWCLWFHSAHAGCISGSITQSSRDVGSKIDWGAHGAAIKKVPPIWPGTEPFWFRVLFDRHQIQAESNPPLVHRYNRVGRRVFTHIFGIIRILTALLHSVCFYIGSHDIVRWCV